MEEHASAQLNKLTHDSEVHAILLMDLLRLVCRMDPAAFRPLVERAERELRELAKDPEAHRLLEQRLVFLRAAEIVSERAG